MTAYHNRCNIPNIPGIPHMPIKLSFIGRCFTYLITKSFFISHHVSIHTPRGFHPSCGILSHINIDQNLSHPNPSGHISPSHLNPSCHINPSHHLNPFQRPVISKNPFLEVLKEGAIVEKLDEVKEAKDGFIMIHLIKSQYMIMECSMYCLPLRLEKHGSKKKTKTLTTGCALCLFLTFWLYLQLRDITSLEITILPLLKSSSIDPSFMLFVSLSLWILNMYLHIVLVFNLL
ncbi:F5J5.8 [Arabidopsis thaliana]|uniref:F5J5.8 n=1 Tax=Arabidopsis thaliana TaxID=3702 RepID=Q9SKW2_ARATH|nr:F5J5.8 [Arabidopsis thaliana]